MSGRALGSVAAGTLALATALAGCGADPAPAAKPLTQTVKQCQARWRDVAESVLGLDQDTNPSALASRWTSVSATVDYYATSTSAKNCQAIIETQVRAITALREFSEKLQPYDMAYQVGRVSAAVDLYLHDPVPKSARNADGKRVKAPTHAKVSEAIQTLTDQAADANAELQPGWAQLASVSLDDADAVSSAIDDLDLLAQHGNHWARCQTALQVIVAAIRAQEGLLGTPEDQPSATPTG